MDMDVTTRTGTTSKKVATDATRLLDHLGNNDSSTASHTDPESNDAPPSLTSDYDGFLRSSGAVSVLSVHLVVYYALAVVGYSYVVGRWSVVDSLYFATTLCTTIGFGDLAPTDATGRLFTMFLAFYGIVILGILLGIIGDYLVEWNNQVVHEERTKAGDKIVQLLHDDNRVENPDEILPTGNGEDSRVRSLWCDVGTLAVQEAPVLAVVAVVGWIVGMVEGWNVMDTLYWLVITSTTIGFGDFHPNKSGVKLFCVVFLPLCVAAFGRLLGRIASLYMDRKRRMAERQFLSRSLTLSDLSTMDADKDGLVDRGEFLSYMLITLQKVSREDVQQIMSLFQKLDVDKTQFLNKDDIAARDWDESFRHAVSHTYQPRV